MPKVKVPRKNISLDMTAMCDMAFLLLTFFMLTTKFKAQEAIAVDIPSSVSETQKPEKNIMTISIDKTGSVYFDLDRADARIDLLGRMAEKYSLNLSDQEVKIFGNMTSFGVPMNGMKNILNMTQADREKINQPGIPCDSINNELKDWVRLAVESNPSLDIAIKGDRISDYEVMDQVIATLQNENINKFNLITSLENH